MSQIDRIDYVPRYGDEEKNKDGTCSGMPSWIAVLATIDGLDFYVSDPFQAPNAMMAKNQAERIAKKERAKIVVLAKVVWMSYE